MITGMIVGAFIGALQGGFFGAIAGVILGALIGAFGEWFGERETAKMAKDHDERTMALHEQGERMMRAARERDEQAKARRFK